MTMKLRHSLIIGCLTALLGVGAFVFIPSANQPNAQKAEANNTTVTFYVAVNTADIGSNNMTCNLRLGDGDYTDYQNMTMVEKGITYSGKNVYSYTFTEKYGGAEFHLRYFVGAVEHYVHASYGDWTAVSTFSGKLYTFESGEGSSWVSYSIPTRYSLVGSGSGWENDIDLTSNGDGTYSTIKDFVINEQFKIRQNHCWYGGWGYNNVSGTGSTYFVDSDGKTGNNFKCTFGGNYTIKFNPTNSSFVITDNTSETFSYILTMKDDYSCGYLYNSDSDKYSEWIPAPAFSSLGGGQAYNVKIDYNSDYYYGLYKISDRYLSSFTYLIAKKSGNYSGAYDNQSCTFTVTDPHSVYICNNTATPVYVTGTSTLYNALEFIYDLVGHRGNASYDNHSFDYSICATSVSEAERLINAYDNVIGAGAQAICEISYCYVYKLTGGYNETNKEYRTISDMVDALRLIVEKNSNNGSPANALVNNTSGSDTTMVAILSSFTALVTVGGFFFIRKKKVM